MLIKPSTTSLLPRSVIVVAALLAASCSQRPAPPDELKGDLDDPEIRAQLQGSSGGGDQHPGALLYAENCATCHDTGVARAPAKNLLQLLTPDAVLGAMNTGVMRQQASTLSATERAQLTEFLVGSADVEPLALQHCDATDNWFDWQQPPMAAGWGIDHANTRNISAAQGQLTTQEVSSLKVKWVFDYPRASRARSHPSFAGGAVFVGSQSGSVYALDANSGCVRWVHQAGAEVRTGITISNWAGADEPRAIGYFSDVLARVYAVDLTSGERLWRSVVDDHPNATTTAQPVLFENLLMQPVSSLEVVPAADPAYPCCSFRGSIATLNAQTGELLRKTYTIDQAPTQVDTNNVGTPVLAPSGAPVWNTPTLDAQARRVYFGTGENYSSPADGYSDAIFAMNIDDGSIAWVRQTTARDAWNVACMVFIENKTNCPVEKGPDLDFGSPPILVRWEGQSMLVAGQKSGEVFGINPDNGEMVWRNKIGRGGNQGGIHFGMAADGRRVFVPMSDYTDGSVSAEDARPGLYAVDAFSGELVWSQPADNICGDKTDCDPGISAAISVVDGAVLAGHMDGRLRAYSVDDGEVLWSFDSDRTFISLAGREARGGSFGGGTAPVAYRGLLYVNSGYGLYFHRPGNALIVLEP
ncbi:MAG: PQQ-binding-like beta-propeller repeat protein [Lysobacterales bacterium]